MSAPLLYTFQDLISHLVDQLGGGALAANQREFRMAVHAAYQEVGNTRDWQSQIRQGRVMTSAPYQSGTIQYQQSSGPVPNYVTLTTTDGTTWPENAIYGILRCNNINSQIQSLLSPTTLQLDPHVNFGADLPAGTPYIWYQSHYPLPADFRRTNELLYAGTQWLTNYLPQYDMLRLERIICAGGYPTHFSVVSSPRLINTWELWLYPYPSTQASIDFIYGSAPRQINFTGFEPGSTAGTVSISSGATNVSGVGTTFSAAMVGAAFRVSADPTQQPTGIGGLNPWTEQKIITSVTGGGQLTVDSPFVNGYTGTTYCVTDPIDVVPDLLEFLMRTSEYKIAMVKNLRQVQLYRQQYIEARMRAFESDQRVIQPRYIGGNQLWPRLLRWMPFNSSMAP